MRKKKDEILTYELDRCQVHVPGNDALQQASKDGSLRDLVRLVTENEAPSEAPPPPSPSGELSAKELDEIMCEVDPFYLVVERMRDPECGLIIKDR